MTRKRTKRSKATDPRLYPYQRQWVRDESRFKIACKARQIGFTFAAAWRVVDKRLEEPGLTLWISASERQALEAMEHIRRFCRELKVVAEYEEEFIEGMSVKQRVVRLPNGSRIIALPANPDTVRGFAGDVVLDEFAFHRDAEAIWRAAFATATRGFQIEIISTPNGTRGKYYELAKAAGLVDWQTGMSAPLNWKQWAEEAEKRKAEKQIPPPESRTTVFGTRDDDSGASAAALHPREGTTSVVPKKAAREARPRKSERSGDPALFAGGSGETLSGFPQRKADDEARTGFVAATQPTGGSPWAEQCFASSTSVFSPHWVDLATAGAQGFRVDVEALRTAIGDENAWEQEYCCRFLSDAAHFIPPELVVAAESPAATTWLPVAGATGLSEEGSQSWRVRPSGLTSEPSRAALPGMGSGETPFGFPQRLCYLGADIGRKRDLTVLWLLEAENTEALPEAQTYVTRGVLTLDRQPFAQQRAVLDALLGQRIENNENRKQKIENGPSFQFPVSSFAFLVRRCALDASGLGAMLAEELAAKWGARVEPVVFTAAVKEEMAVRVKRLLEERRLKIPYDPAIRAALGSVKRFVTAAGNVRFDAERTDASGHADHFWALALALHAADSPALSVDFVSRAQPRAFAQLGAF